MYAVIEELDTRFILILKLRQGLIEFISSIFFSACCKQTFCIIKQRQIFLYGARIPFHLLFGWRAAKGGIKAGVIGEKNTSSLRYGSCETGRVRERGRVIPLC